MSLNAGIRDLMKAVKRLEAVTSKGQKHCSYCRYMLRHSWPDPKEPKSDPEDVIKATCEFCFSEYKVNLAGVPEEEREALRLLYSFTTGDFYTNPRAHALELWREHRLGRTKGAKRFVRV